MSKVIVISGPSGVGKTTIYKKLLNELSDKIDFSISATTREPRKNEVNGVDYYFVSREEFENLIKNNEFVEWAIVYDHYYGTLKKEIERITKSGKNCLLDVDVQGGVNVKRNLPDSYLIFIKPPSKEALKERLIGRNLDDEKEIEKRLDVAEKEMKYAGFYDVVIENDDLESCYKRVKSEVLRVIES
ncbi:MAG: guanylate kinase [Brevinematia bacterium]